MPDSTAHPSPLASSAPEPTGADLAWATGLLLISMVAFFVVGIIRGTQFNTPPERPTDQIENDDVP